MVDSIRRDIFDWAVLSVAGLTALLCFGGAIYTVPWTAVARNQATTKRFNFLWITRCSLQVVGVVYALSMLLPLRVLWGAGGVARSADAAVICRVFLAANLGFLEPTFLLIALCSCAVPLSSHWPSSRNPNLPVLLLATAWALPTCLVQVFAALFTRIVNRLDYQDTLVGRFFLPFYTVREPKCPAHHGTAACQLCVYPELSTLISFSFALVYLGCLYYLTHRIAAAAINKVLARRTRLLQLAVALPLLGSICARGATVVFQPYQMGFALLRLGAVVGVAVLVCAVCFIVAWRPVFDAAQASRYMKDIQPDELPIEAPNELMPLVALVPSKTDSGGAPDGEPDATNSSH